MVSEQSCVFVFRLVCAVLYMQVEHPVTEGITDTNIPSIQLMVGMGIPLWRIPCVRATFNKDPNVSTPQPVQPAAVFPLGVSITCWHIGNMLVMSKRC